MKRARKNGCTGKRRFTEPDAIKYAIISRKTGKRPMYAYRCDFCSSWHLTQQKGGRLEYLFRQIEEARNGRA